MIDDRRVCLMQICPVMCLGFRFINSGPSSAGVGVGEGSGQISAAATVPCRLIARRPNNADHHM